MIVLSEYTPLEKSIHADNLKMITEVAKKEGCQVFFLPPDFERFGGAEKALQHIPSFQNESAIWAGFIPSRLRYQEVYEVLRNKGLHLPNTPEEHTNVLHFPKFYPLIEDLTPKSWMIYTLEDCEQIQDLTFPVFLKGSVLSLKSQGKDACVANNLVELKEVAQRIWRRAWAQGEPIIIRDYVSLRYTQETLMDFPMGREYRIFLYQNEVLGLGYYWGEEHELSQLTTEEEDAVKKLAIQASQKIGTPYTAIDIGQKTDMEWIVIESGDPQFCGLGTMSIEDLWRKLVQMSFV